MTLRVISDLHLSHRKLVRLRGFSPAEDNQGVTTEEILAHDQWLIDAWNHGCSPSDTTFVLGDVAFSDPRPLLAQLKGRVILICGNHDLRWKKQLRSVPSISRTEDVLLLKHENQRFWLSHYAHEAWPHRGSERHRAYHLHGHSHGRLKPRWDRLDVSVDSVGPHPLRLETAVGMIHKQNRLIQEWLEAQNNQTDDSGDFDMPEEEFDVHP